MHCAETKSRCVSMNADIDVWDSCILTAVAVREQPRQSTFMGTTRAAPWRSMELVVCTFPVGGNEAVPFSCGADGPDMESDARRLLKINVTIDSKGV